MAKEVLVIYLPVIHAGYENLFEQISVAIYDVYVLDIDLINEFSTLHTEIRALKPERAVRYLRASGYFNRVRLLNKNNLYLLSKKPILTIDDQLCHRLAEMYFVNNSVRFENVFLRYDDKSVFSQEPVNYSRISNSPFDRQIMALARTIAPESSDWWRRVGAVLIKNGKIILTSHNEHLPSEYTPYINGDPRDFIQAGQRSELCSAVHAEAKVISLAANKGMKLSEGDSFLYVSVFPCPSCARFIAYSGIKRLYFGSGHASLEGDKVMKASGIEIIFVK